MKTFKQLLPGDTLYVCHSGNSSFTKIEVLKCEPKEITTNHSGDCKKLSRSDKSCVHVTGYYHYEATVFVNKSDALRYCKSQGLRHLRKLIEDAKKAAGVVYEFRKTHFDRLNKHWVEAEINELERMERAL